MISTSGMAYAILRQAQDERLCAGHLADSTVFPAQAGIHAAQKSGRLLVVSLPPARGELVEPPPG